MKKTITLVTIIIIAIPFHVISFSNDNGLQDSPWPMFRHDVRHTGRSEYDASKIIVKKNEAIGKDGTIYTIVFYSLPFL